MPLSPPKRVLVVSASIGGGHVSAARALEEAAGAGGLEVKHVDMLDYTTAPFQKLYKRTYFDLVRTAPDLVDWLGKRMDRLPREDKTRRERVRARLTRLVSYKLPRLIRAYAPDVIVHTHFLPPEILSTLGSRLAAPQTVVVTDFAAHSLWLQPGVARYFVATDDVAVHLRSAGVAPARVRVTGVPIDARFKALPPKGEARETLALSKDRDVLLVMAGGLDARTLEALVTQLKAFQWPLMVVIVCGRSGELVNAVKGMLEGYQDRGSLVHFRVLGFVREVPLYMAAADLMVGKPGGLTTSEALAAGLPFAVVQPYPLQEEANTNFLLEHGAALRIEPLTLFSHKLKGFFEDTGRREAMRKAARGLAKPDAAERVVRSLLTETS